MKIEDLEQIDFPDQFADELAQRLSPKGCLTLLGIALRITDRKAAVELTLGYLEQQLTGSPVPPLLDFKDQARWWAQLASEKELRAHLLAIFECLPQSRRDKFIDYYNANKSEFDKAYDPKSENDPEEQELRGYLGVWDVIMGGLDKDSWEYNYAETIAHRKNWNHWYPSEKQRNRILMMGRQHK